MILTKIHGNGNINWYNNNQNDDDDDNGVKISKQQSTMQKTTSHERVCARMDKITPKKEKKVDKTQA